MPKTATIPVEIPSRGMSTRYSLAKMPPQFSPYIQNYEVGPGFLESREGTRRLFNASRNFISAMAANPANVNELVHLDLDTLGGYDVEGYNIVTGARGSTIALSGTGLAGTKVSNQAQALGFAGNVIFFNRGITPFIFNGTTNTVLNVTGPTLANVVGGTTHNSQLYVFEHERSSVWFRDSPGAFTGALTEYDISVITKDNGLILCAFSFTLSSGDQSQNLFCIVTDSGEAFVFSGVDPADSSWALVGRSQIGTPIGYQSFIEANGDVFVMTRSGIISMRALYTSASRDLFESNITFEIQKYWNQLIRDTLADDAATNYDPRTSLLSFFSGVYHAGKNKLLVFCPRRLAPVAISAGKVGYELQDEVCALVYDFSAQAWTVFNLPTLTTTGLEFLQGISTYYSARHDTCIFATIAVDDESAYQIFDTGLNCDTLFESEDPETPSITADVLCELHTAPINIGTKQRVSDVRITHSGDAEVKSSTQVELVAELGGSYNSFAQNSLSDGISRDIYNIGIDGHLVNARIKSTLSTSDTERHSLVEIEFGSEPGNEI